MRIMRVSAAGRRVALLVAVVATASASRLLLRAQPAASQAPAGQATVSTPGGDRGVLMLADEGEAAKYWPRWRGPSGQGLVSGAGYPDRWSATQNVRWRTQVPGQGNSSPIAWRDRLYLTTAHDSGARLSLLAFDRATGKLLWEASAAPGDRDRAHPKNGYASATPATDGERIYVSFGSRGLYAFDMDGRQVWRRDIGAISNYHGPAGSPLLYRNRIILYQDHDGGGFSRGGGGFIAAFDNRTGRELWRTPREQSVGWGTPVAVRIAGHDEIIVNGQSRVMAYNPDTGAELWRCSGMSHEVIPTPVVGYGMVFCSSGRAGPTLAIRPGGRGDVTKTHLAWNTERGSPFVPSPLLYREQLYTVNDMASIVTSFEAQTGRVLWQGRLGVAQREGFSASPVAVDGKVFFTNDQGETFVLKAGPAFELLHVNRLDERTLASPALVDGTWYIRTDRHLLAIGQ